MTLLRSLAEPCADTHLFGWQSTPGIVSVWASRDGHALVWQRDGDRVFCRHDRFRPWIVATSLADLAHLGSALQSDRSHVRNAPIQYRELDGPAGSYRYLLMARSERVLERAIVAGASRRLDHPVNSLYTLDDTYYRVGAVEQYLMATGQVYFQGLAYSELHRLQFDLETTALDPQQGRIFLVAVRDSRGLATTLEAPRPEDEAQLIADLCDLIQAHDPDVIENHNLFGFDLPFLEHRAAVLNVPLLLGRTCPPGIGPTKLDRYADPYARGASARQRKRPSIVGRELIDTLDAVRRYDFAARDLPSHRLKDVAKYFGVAAPERVYLAGDTIFDTYRSDPQRARHYALDDVAEVDGLSQRLLGAPFALASMAPRRYERLASAGPAMGILEPMLVRAYLHANAALPAPNSTDGNASIHEGGAVHLFATGVAEHVVKADVASLYPSIMRTFGIGPSTDRLGVLLHIVSRLTDLRLEHKAAARSATPGSLRAAWHDGQQAAMKILINAAYGYMGAGHMAMFADSHAASEVTWRGRIVLDQVVHGLQQRGMTLIEADTDGVYFAVPPVWSEAEERTLVQAVAADLPDGIRLEYEGRYRAMLSHEVKNYALLKYDGTLIVRGVALRSSRVEPYGERFLRQALQCTLVGDVAGVRDAFLATITALRDRALPTADLATRVRLSKTAEAYLATRSIHRAQQYEAMLAAGRTAWAAYERMRVYRAQHGASVWLPDAIDEGASTNVVGTPSGLEHMPGARADQVDRRDYDVEHYVQLLLSSYAARLRKAFAPSDWEQLFRLDLQTGLFDAPIDQIEPLWIRCPWPPQTSP